jgi:N-formylmaleamate deformylase
LLRYIENDLIVNGVTLHYYRTGGNKPPFVLLHGSADSGLCWSPVAEWLSEQFDVIMPDAQGHGLSERLTPDFKSINMADQAAGLIQRLNLDRPSLMGHSMGADTLVDLALRYPSIPSCIILEDPIWQIQPVPGQETPQQIKRREKMAQAVIGFSQKSTDDLIAERQRSNPTWSDEDMVRWAQSKKQFDSSLFTSARDRRFTYQDFVTRADCPTLLITAEWGMVAPETAQKATDLWQSSYPFRWVHIMRAGHNIRRDQFEKFKEAAGNFLELLK